MKEMILKPRQSPKRPPRDEKKSFHVILALLSISKKILLITNNDDKACRNRKFSLGGINIEKD